MAYIVPIALLLGIAAPLWAFTEIAEAWPGARLETTKGLGRLAHYRILRHRPAITAGVDFIGTP